MIIHSLSKSFPCVSDSKASACNAGDLGLIPGLRRSRQLTPVFLPGESARTEVPGRLVHGVAESDMTEQLSTAHSLSDGLTVLFPAF